MSESEIEVIKEPFVILVATQTAGYKVGGVRSVGHLFFVFPPFSAHVSYHALPPTETTRTNGARV